MGESVSPLCWPELSEVKIFCPKMIHEVEEKVKFICEKLKEAIDCQNPYIELKWKEIKFEVGE